MYPYQSGVQEVAPSRVRGLKPGGVLALGIPACRTLTGAWIETAWQMSGSLLALVAPSRVRGLKPAQVQHGGIVQ